MNAIIIGGTGLIGSAVTSLLRGKGWNVLPVSRTTNPAIDITIAQNIEHFFTNVAPADAIIVAAGDGAMIDLSDIHPNALDISTRGKLWGQMQVVSKGMNKLKPHGVFVLTGGILAYKPFPKTSLMATTNAAVEGFVRAASLDLTEGRRIIVVHPDWVKETAVKAGMDGSTFPDAEETAKAYWRAIQSKETGIPIFLEGREPKRGR